MFSRQLSSAGTFLGSLLQSGKSPSDLQAACGSISSQRESASRQVPACLEQPPAPPLWFPRPPVTLGSPLAQGVQSSGCSRWGGGFGGRLFNWTPSLLTKGKSQEPRGGGWKARGFISHFSASQELLVVFPFNFMFLSCSGNLEKFGNHLSIFIREIFFSSEL